MKTSLKRNLTTDEVSVVNDITRRCMEYYSEREYVENEYNENEYEEVKDDFQEKRQNC